MKISKSKSFSLFALFLSLIITVSIFTLPTAFAASRTTFAYMSLAPDPVGVGQQVTVIVWANWPAGSPTNTERFHNFTVTVTTPNGTIQHLFYIPGSNEDYVVWDTASSASTTYIPLEVGVYSFLFEIPAQTIGSDTYTGSNTTAKLTVQVDPIPEAIDSYPLPSEYWARPIEGQNSFWFMVSSNWYNSVRDRNSGGYQNNRYQPDGIAPGTAHIMWAQSIADLKTDDIGFSDYVSKYYDHPLFANQIIMNGMLYYPMPNPTNLSFSSGWRIVDLRTGTQFFSYWGPDEPSLGMNFNTDYYNQHGVISPGAVYTANYARGLEAKYLGRTAAGIAHTTNAPKGIDTFGGHGEYLRISLVNAGSSSSPNWVVRQWNISKYFGYSTLQAVSSDSGTTPPGSNRYDFYNNRPVLRGSSQAVLSADTVEAGLIFTMDPYTYQMTEGVLLCRNGTLPSQASSEPYTYFAISLFNQTINGRPLKAGQIMWMENYDAPSGGYTLVPGPAVEGVWTMVIKETGQWMGFDMLTGIKLWETEPQINNSPYAYTEPTNASGATVVAADGKLFTAGYSGIVYCYDLHNGTLLWNKAFPMLYAADVVNYPTHIGVVCDGKIYLGTYNPKDDQSLLSGAMIYCLSTDDGSELWSMPSFGGPGGFAVADGYMVYLNYYDLKVYSVGKGPSQTTVTSSPKVALNGASLTVKGTCTDVSPGSPIKGSAAISDKDMGAWMAYKFMNQTKPDAVGVDVTLNVIDPNGNQYDIGNATVDMNGEFNFEWTPPVPGQYSVTATFAGTESYWPSFAHSTFYVSGETLATTTPTQSPQTPMTQTYLLYSTGAIVAALLAAALILALVVKRKNP